MNNLQKWSNDKGAMENIFDANRYNFAGTKSNKKLSKKIFIRPAPCFALIFIKMAKWRQTIAGLEIAGLREIKQGTHQW